MYVMNIKPPSAAMQGQRLNPWIPLHCCLATKHFIPLSKILHVKWVIFLSYFNQIWSFSTDFLKSCQCQILQNLSSLSRTDTRKQVNTWTINRHDKANIRFSATCANPRNKNPALVYTSLQWNFSSFYHPSTCLSFHSSLFYSSKFLANYSHVYIFYSKRH